MQQKRTNEELFAQLSGPDWWAGVYQEPLYKVQYRGTDWLDGALNARRARPPVARGFSPRARSDRRGRRRLVPDRVQLTPRPKK